VYQVLPNGSVQAVVPILLHDGSDAPDISSVPGHADDPRVVGNLVRPPHRTCAEQDMWLAPFTPGLDTSVSLLLPCDVTLAAMRFYNYNARCCLFFFFSTKTSFVEGCS
jgi:hypothetical protein